MAGSPLFPLQGTPGVADFRNPTLVPNFYRPVANGNTLDLDSPATYLAANVRADATMTATIGGSATSGDVVAISVTNPVFGGTPYGNLVPAQIGHVFTVGVSDTLDTIADGLADLFNNDALAQQAGLRADVVGAVITFHWNGPIGNLSGGTSGVSPQTVTVGGSTSGGDKLNVTFTGPAFAAQGGSYTVTYTTVSGDTTTTLMATHLASAITADAVMTALSITASGSAAVVTITIPAAAEPAVVTVSKVGASVTIALGGTGIATETVTFGGSGKFASGTGPVIPTNNFTWFANGSASTFWYGQPIVVGYDQLSAMLTQGMPIT